MNRVEAMEWAADYAERSKIFAPITNSRGYSDGWKPPTPAEKARIIAELAETVVDEPAPSPLALAAGELLNVLKTTVDLLDDAYQVDPAGYNYTRVRTMHNALKERLEEIASA